MLDKCCTFQFNTVDKGEVSKLLKSLPDHSSVGTDMLDSKVLSLAADYVYGPICHIKCMLNERCFSHYLERR